MRCHRPTAQLLSLRIVSARGSISHFRESRSKHTTSLTNSSISSSMPLKETGRGADDHASGTVIGGLSTAVLGKEIWTRCGSVKSEPTPTWSSAYFVDGQTTS